MAERDLTEILEHVGKTLQDAAHARNEAPAPWDDLPPLAKRSLKEALLPIVLATLECIDKNPADAASNTPNKVMQPYDWNSRDYPADMFPDAYENQEHQHDLSTCSVWVLHLNIRPEAKGAVLERMSELPETTGAFIYGDSWEEWGEKSKGDDDMHLAIYFKANPREAWRIGSHIADHALVAAQRASNDAINTAFAISTSGDYAEQLREPA